MSIFAIIFAVVILSFFWGGFVYMLLYSLKLKGSQGQADDDDEPESASQRVSESVEQ